MCNGARAKFCSGSGFVEFRRRSRAASIGAGQKSKKEPPQRCNPGMIRSLGFYRFLLLKLEITNKNTASFQIFYHTFHLFAAVLGKQFIFNEVPEPKISNLSKDK